MPRKAGIDAPGALHHIICRGIERRNIFKDNAERWTLTKITERVAEIFGIEKDQVVVAGKQPDRVRTCP